MPEKDAQKPKKPAKPTSWEPVAGWYDNLLADDDTYQSKVILPNLLRLMPPEGKKVLDIACGQGFFSQAYAKAGANVLGVDISPQLIKLARENAGAGAGAGNESDVGGGSLKFEVSPADKIPFAANEVFDSAMIVLALQNIKEMGETLKEAARALKKDGSLVLVLNHPCFRIPKASAWDFDEKNKIQYRRIDKYGRPFSIKVDMTPGKTSASEKIFTMSFHRPLQDYMKALSSAGFVVAGLEEWISHKQSQAGPRAEAEDNARKEFPLFLAIVARKL